MLDRAQKHFRRERDFDEKMIPELSLTNDRMNGEDLKTTL